MATRIRTVSSDQVYRSCFRSAWRFWSNVRDIEKCEWQRSGFQSCARAQLRTPQPIDNMLRATRVVGFEGTGSGGLPIGAVNGPSDGEMAGLCFDRDPAQFGEGVDTRLAAKAAIA